MRESVLLVPQLKFQSEKRKKNMSVERRTMMIGTRTKGKGKQTDFPLIICPHLSNTVLMKIWSQGDDNGKAMLAAASDPDDGE